MKSRFDLRRRSILDCCSDIRFESLETRVMLAADFGLVDAYESSLLTHVQSEVSVDQRLDILRAHLDAGTDDSFELIKHSQDQIGFEHFRYQHHFRGLPVESSIYTVHAKDGQIVSLSGEYHAVNEAAMAATITESAALDYALQHINADIYIWEDGGQMTALTGHRLEPDGQGQDHQLQFGDISFEIPRAQMAYADGTLVYKFDIYAVDPLSRSWIMVDATNGNIVEVQERINKTDVPGTGTTLYDGNVNMTVDFTGTNYRLRQVVPGVETFDANNANNYNSATDITSPTANFSDPGTHIGNQTHWATAQTWDYFFSQHGRDSFDDQGTTLVSYVSFGTNFVNAFWNGSFMTYGDGDGTTRGPLVSLDIVGHEITHGVTQYASGLIYQDQSGALNESFSDIFGEAVENHARGSNDWLMGGDIGLNGNAGQFRNMISPNLFNDPDTYLGDYWYTGQGDHGGVHINSGVQNKWFYLMVAGESGTNDTGFNYNVTGIGMQDSAAIAYRNLTQYLAPNATYPDARVGAIQSAIDLFGVGSQQHLTTMAAWDAVGVYDLSLDLDLLAIDSLGSLVYADSAINDIGFASDVDEFTIFLDENQTISLALQNLNGGLLPEITIVGPSSAVLATASAPTTADTVLIQNLAVADAGAYTLQIGGDVGTTGFYQLDFQLNAALEEEPLGLGDNDTMVNAQDLDGTALTQGFLLTSEVERLAVTGELGGNGASVAAESFESGVLDSAWTTNSSTTRGRIAVVSDTGTPDGSFALSMDVDTNGAFNLNEAIYTVDMTGVAEANLTFAHTSFGDETHLLPSTYVNSFNGDGVSISDDGINWTTIMTGVTPASGVWVDFEIDIVDAATTAGLTLGANFRVKFQQYDNFTRNSDGRAYDNISIGLESNDFYSFTLDPAEHATIGVTQVIGDPSEITLELYDAAQTLLASGVAGTGVSSYIENFENTDGSAATFYINVVGAGTQYNLEVTRGANHDLENGLDQDISDFDGVLGYVSDAVEVVADPDAQASGTDVSNLFPGVVLSNPLAGGGIFAVASSFTAPTGSNVFGTSAANDDGFRDGTNELRADFAELQAFVSIDTGSDDTLDIGFLRAYDAADNLLEEVIGSGVPHSGSETLAIQRTSADISYIIAGGVGSHTTPLDNLVYEQEVVDSDTFDVLATIGQQLDFQAYLPGDGPFEFDNRLTDGSGNHFLMELFDPTGTSVATGSEVISHVAASAGTYQLQVSTEDGSGEYYVAREINIVPDKFDFGPDTSAVAVDWTQADDDDYDPVKGYGFVGRKRALSMVNFSRGNDLTGDGIAIASGTFVVDVENGTYDVSMHFGFGLHLDSVRVTVEGTAYDLTPQARQVETWQTTVADGQLTLGLSGNFGLDSLIRFAGLEISEVMPVNGFAGEPMLPSSDNERRPDVGEAIAFGEFDKLNRPSIQIATDQGPWTSRLFVIETIVEPPPQYLEPMDFHVEPVVELRRAFRTDRVETLSANDLDERGQLIGEMLDEWVAFEG